MALVNTIRWRITGSADTRGMAIKNLRESDENRRICWLVAPVHDPDYYVADTSFHLRSVGHEYILPGPERGSGFDAAAWAAPGADNLRNFKPPSGFPNICIRIDTAQNGAGAVYAIKITGFDCLLRKLEETITLDNTTGAAGTIRAWGRVGWRHIQRIELIDAPTLVAEDLRIGWDFVNTQVVATFYDTPERDDDGGGSPNWRTGFPFEFKRDSLHGVSRVHNVDGSVEFRFNAWPIASNSLVKNRNNVLLGAGVFHGGWIGSDGLQGSLEFNGGYFGTDTIDGQTRQTWQELNVWGPSANHRPEFSSGKDATPDPINTVLLNMYAFLLHEWRDVQNLQTFED